MNKELETLYTPLQSLNNIRDKYFHDKEGSELEHFWFNKIETALKDYQHLCQIWNCKDSDTMIIQTTKTIHDENNKKLKALESIKKKTNLTTTNDGKKALVFVILETEEEYDLLKEVLL